MQVQYTPEDQALGNFWTKIRDKVIKPVGRVVAAYYTGGASEVAFKAYDANEAKKKAAAAQAAYLKAVGTGYGAVPSPYPNPNDPAAMQAYISAGGVMPPTPPQKLPEWVLPAGVGIGALVLVSMLKRRD